MNIAIVGATGLVGSTFIKILEEETLPIENIYFYASKRSAGTLITFNNKTHTVLELTEENIKNKNIDYALFSAGGTVSENYAPIFTKYNITVIDNSSAWRMDDSVPLIVPEVNMDSYKSELLIANPNCSTIQAVVPLVVLNNLYKLKTVTYTTFQAVSGSGLKGINDLERTAKNEIPTNYKYPIHNNVLPQIDVFMDNGYTKEEIKMINETKKILNIDIPVTATCVRVPVLNSHSVEIYVELEKEPNIKELRQALQDKDGISLVDDIKKEVYPIPTFATNQNDILVGRIRKDINNNKRLHLFCVADNIRKGAALNAIQIMMNLIKRSDQYV